MNRLILSCVIALAISVPQVASAYLVANAVSLEELFDKHSDVVFKGTVVSTAPIDDESFGKVNGYQPYETVFRVVSVVKGEIDAKEIRFRHYSINQDGNIMRYSPQSYQFQVNRTYIVCAKNTKTPAIWRQIWDSHRSKEDQGVLRAADDQPHVGDQLADVYWHELSRLLRSKQPDDAMYAIDQFNSMTGIGHGAHKDLDRAKALDEIVRLVDSEDDELAIKAIGAIALETPQIGDSIWRLFALNPAHFPGHSTPAAAIPNAAAKKYRAALIRIAGSDLSPPRRAAAITSLGQSRDPELVPLIQKWITDQTTAVRSAATILLAEYASEVSNETWQTLLKDETESVRRSAIRAIGIGKVRDMMDEVNQLLDEENPAIVADAAATLLSFPLADSRPILESRIEHPQYGCLLINVLAAEDTAAYADQLGEIIRTVPVPEAWWGGHQTWGVSWNLLFKYVQQQPEGRVRAGDFDAELASLESPVTEREQSNHYSSSEPRDLYALYVQRGMHKRAKAYREVVVKKTRYDMNEYLNKVDGRPNDFQRR